MSERETAAAGRINWRRILPILLTTSLVGGICGIFVINELDRQHDGRTWRPTPKWPWSGRWRFPPRPSRCSTR
ncbi:hypothetical protein P4237_33155 [Pseudomonas aeruginosa]|nr:hypothetical protein [Pseudomonas aeruginosa]